MKIASLLKTVIVSGCLSAAGVSPAAFADVKLNGSGTSFPFPIYAKWLKDFSKANKGVCVDYQSKGSGAGIRDFQNQVVDFAASDAAMNDDEIVKAKDGVVLRYCLTDGQKVADRLGYIPLNQEAVDAIVQHIDAIN